MRNIARRTSGRNSEVKREIDGANETALAAMTINPMLYERRKLIRSRHTRLIGELISVAARARTCWVSHPLRFVFRCSRTTVGAGLADISNGSVAQTVMEPIIESNTGREENG